MGTKWILASVLFVGIFGCANTVHQSARMGNRYEAKPSNCDVQFAYRDPMKVWDTKTQEMIGLINVELADDGWTDGLKEAVRPKVCEIGGDTALISVMGVNSMSGARGTRVEVFRTKTQAMNKASKKVSTL